MYKHILCRRDFVMKFRRILAIGCAIMLLLVGCQTNKNGNAGEQTSSQEQTKKVKLAIDGYDKEHYPRLDGSLANEPLLKRMLSDLTDTDLDTAETYLADSFV
ncbi:MAG: hypothetical protein Q4B61_13995, partial [Bacteroidales bacterium]|nr:hypothetical protein [Bacteroidales bacterium]